MSDYRTTSSDIIIDRVMTLFKFANTDWIADAIEYMGDAIQAIGTTAPLQKTSKVLEVESHRVKIPCDMEVLFFVEYNGRRLRLGGDFTGYGLVDKERTTAIYKSSTDNTGLITFEGDPAEIENTLLIDDENYYLINPNYIQTSFEEGTIKIHYGGYPLDKNGLPVIPDEFNYRNAVVWYIIFQMLLTGYEHPKITWADAEARWERYLPKAQNESVMADIGEMDRFRAMWTRLIPTVQLPWDFFAGSESDQFIAGV